jgi:hypothetical protein
VYSIQGNPDFLTVKPYFFGRKLLCKNLNRKEANVMGITIRKELYEVIGYVSLLK